MGLTTFINTTVAAAWSVVQACNSHLGAGLGLDRCGGLKRRKMEGLQHLVVLGRELGSRLLHGGPDLGLLGHRALLVVLERFVAHGFTLGQCRL